MADTGLTQPHDQKTILTINFKWQISIKAQMKQNPVQGDPKLM